ncbi:ABC transporter substrate-binding protein [Microbacterium sp. RD1]|uniref:ABC transporter substrate-binding protein n=1 Tax=Microbacterium sp. RD1 TaxID=3457313 RepID=UPI003FA61131
MRTSTTAVRGAAALAVLAAAATLGSCSAPTPPEEGGALQAIVVGATPAADVTAPFIAMEQGFFDDVGLDVTIQPLAGGSALVPALESNSMQIGSSNLLSNLQAKEQGLDLKCIAGIFKGTSSQSLILAPGAEGSIASAADLEGKTVGINTLGNVAQLVVSNWAARNGADPTKIDFVAVGFPDQASALTSGQIDAALAVEPFNTIMRDSQFPVLERDPIAAVGDQPTFSCWTVSSKWLEEHEAEADAWRAAMRMVDDYVAENPDAIRAAVVDHLGVNADVAAEFELPMLSSEMSQADFDVWMKPAIEFGLLAGEVDTTSFDGGYGK